MLKTLSIWNFALIEHVQINIFIPTGWKTELENLARIYSVEEGESKTFLDLLRIENI